MTKEEKDAPKTEEGKETSQPQPNGNINRNWVDQYYEELNQVLQRFNYFLVATSFMFVAFVTLITNSKNNDLDWIIIFVAIVGILGSLFFFQINYHQTRVAKKVKDQKLKTPLSSKDVDTERWIGDAFSDVAEYIRRHFRYIATERPASHTWFIPFVFIIIWFVSLIGWCITGI